MAYQQQFHLQPAVGSLITRDEAAHVDMSRYRLHWRPDNYARVALREEDTTGMLQCNRAATCRVAEICAFGRPHPWEPHDDDPPQTCYDHRPYVPGGVYVHAVPVNRA